MKEGKSTEKIGFLFGFGISFILNCIYIFCAAEHEWLKVQLFSNFAILRVFLHERVHLLDVFTLQVNNG